MRNIFIVCTGILLLLLGWQFDLQTAVSIDLSSNHLDLTVGTLKTVIPYTVSTQPVTKVTLWSSTGALPIHGSPITIAGNYTFQTIPLPNFFPQILQEPLFGDWWVDRPYRQEIASIDTNAPLPARISFTLLGRTNSTILQLAGSHQVELEIRHGYINRDLFLKIDDHLVFSSIFSVKPIYYWQAILQPCLMSFGLALIIVGIFRIFSKKISPSPSTHASTENAWLVNSVLYVPSYVSFFLFLWVARDVLGSVPHFQDDGAYLIRSRLLQHGLFCLSPSFKELFLQLPHTFMAGKKWITFYPIGWPLLLSIGQLVGHPEIIAPLLGSATTFLIGLTARTIAGTMEALVSQCLWIISPIVLILSGSMMSHAAAAFLVILTVWLLLVQTPNRLVFSGIVLGFLFATRPMTGMVCSILAALWITANCRNVKIFFLQNIRLAFGILPGVCLQLIDNYYTTGAAFTFAYELGAGHSLSLAHLPDSLPVTDFTFAMLLPTLMPIPYGWMPQASYLFAFSPLFLGALFCTARLQKIFLLVLFFSLPLAYLLHNGVGAHGYGARFYYDTLPALFILSGIGLCGIIKNAPYPIISMGMLVCLLSIAALHSKTLPERMLLYQGYNDIDETLLSDLVKETSEKKIIPLQSWGQLVGLAQIFPLEEENPGLLFVSTKEALEEAQRRYPDHQIIRP